MRHGVGDIKKLMRNSGRQPVYKAFSENCPGGNQGLWEKEGIIIKTPSLSGGAGEKACFRDGASNRLAWKLAEFRDKVKRRQTSWEIKRSDFKIKQSLPMSERPWMVTFP